MLPLKVYFKNPSILGSSLLQNYFTWLPDKLYIQLLFRFKLGHWPNLKCPKTFNEKLQWLKLYDRNPEYTQMVDKYAVKKYVASKIGEDHIIPTLGVWERPEDIEWDNLPNQFVLKTTQGGGSGGVVICKDKSKFDIQKAIIKLNMSLKQDLYKQLKEWPYKNVPRRIIAEQFMEDKEGEDLNDYKLFCFNGEVKFAKVDFSRFKDHHANYITPSWSLLPYGEVSCPPDVNHKIEKPENWDQMLDFARKLSRDIPFARIDFYEVKGRTCFGEITFYPASGFGKWTSIDADNLNGKYLKLPGGGGYIIDLQGIIIVVVPTKTKDLPDYKFFCFDGKVKALFIGTERQSGDVKFDYFDSDFHHLDLIQVHPMSGKEISKPKNFEEMKMIASKLSIGIPQVRIDLYEINGKVYFGEMTFYHHGGIVPFHPAEWDNSFGSWIRLPKKFITR